MYGWLLVLVRFKNRFIAENGVTKSEPGLVVKDCINGTFHRIRGVSFKDLFENFSSTGHALCISMDNNYYFKICLDFDIKKDGECVDLSGAPMRLFRENLIECLTVHLSDYFVEFNRKWLESDGNLVIMTNRANLHVYININVSITVYNFIVDTLTLHMADFLNNYKLDKVCSLPLPYSAKRDYQPYALSYPALLENISKDFVFRECADFYDYEIYTQTVDIPNGNTKRHIISYEAKPLCSNNKFSTNYSTMIHVTIPSSSRIKLRNKEPHIISSLCKMSLKRLTSGSSCYQLTNYIVGVRNAKKSIYNVQYVGDQISQNTHSDFIKQALSPLCEYIAERVYSCDPNDPNNTDLGYLINMIERYETWSIYIIFISLIMVHRQINNISDINQFKNYTLELLNVYITNDYAKHCINCMLKYNIMLELNKCFSHNYEELLDYIILQCNFINNNNNAATTIISIRDVNNGGGTVKNDYTDIVIDYVDMLGIDDPTQRFVETIKLVCMPLKTSHLDDLYIYNVNTHTYCTTQNLINNPIVREIMTKFDIKNSSVRNNVCDKITNRTQINNVRFNEYTHFINTSKGIFYTITGTYIPKTPFLYFNIERNFCTTYIEATGNQIDDMNLINSELVKTYEDDIEFLKVYIEEQRKLFYLIHMIPGLLTLNNLIYSHDNAEAMFMCIYKTISDDEINDEHDYYMYPVYENILDYTVCLAKTIRVLTMNRLHEISYFTLKQDYEACDDNSEIKLDDEDIDDSVVFNLSCVLLMLLKHNVNANEKHYRSDREVGRCNEKLKSELINKLDTTNAKYLCNHFAKMDSSMCNYRHVEQRWKYIWQLVFDYDMSLKYLPICCFLSETFNYDSGLVEEYFNQHCTIYQPCGVQKRMNVYYGPPRTEKSTGLQIISEICGDSSTYKTYKDSIKGGPNSIHMKTNYLSIINEISYISPTLLKTMTGDDSTNDERPLYSNKFPMLSCSSMLIATCNDLPRMKNPDEAIRSRLVIYPFLNSAVDTFDKEDANCLLVIAEKKVYSKKFNTQKMAVQLSNLLYAWHRCRKNENGIAPLKVTSAQCLRLTDDFLCYNNWVYKVCRLSDILIAPQLSITLDNLMEHVEDSVQKYGASHGSQYTVDKFVYEFKSLFKGYYEPNLKKYKGIGVCKDVDSIEVNSRARNRNELYKLVQIVEDEEAFTNLRTFKYDMLNKGINPENIHDFIQEKKKMYLYLNKTNLLKGVKFIY